MSLRALWWFLAISLPVLASLIAKISTVDLAYQLRAGAEILATGRIPTTDTWTFTMAGQPWVDQQWAAQIVLRAIESVGGWVGLAAFRAVLVGAIFGGTCLIAVRRGLDVRTGAILSLLAFVVAAPALALRPQLLGMLCFVGVLLLVVDRREHPQRLWLAPVIVAIWANIHGSFFLGPLVLGFAWLEDVHDRLPGATRTLAVAGVAALAACLTPSGPLVWLYAAGLTSNASVTARVTEWQPTSIRDVPGLLFFASALAIVTLIARSGRRVPWPTLAWLGVFFLIGVYAQRGVAWWPIAAVTAIAGTLVPAFPGGRGSRPRRCVASTPWSLACSSLRCSWPFPRIARPCPAPSCRRTPSRRHRLASPRAFATWRIRGPTSSIRRRGARGSSTRCRSSRWPSTLGSRCSGPTSGKRTKSIVSGQDGWERQMAEWGVTHVVVEADATAFRDRLVRAGWEVAYEDADGALLIRR